MADKNDDRIKKESSPIDPELDFRSEQFNPLKALTSDKTYIPVKTAKVFDNIAMFESAMRRQAAMQNPSNTKQTKTKDATAGPSGTTTDRWLGDELTATARRFAPHQGLVICCLQS